MTTSFRTFTTETERGARLATAWRGCGRDSASAGFLGMGYLSKRSLHIQAPQNPRSGLIE